MKNVVAGEDPPAVERDVRVAGVFAANRQNDVTGPNRAGGPPIDIIETNGVPTEKARFGSDQLDVIASQLVAHHVDLMLDHPVGADQEILHRDVLLDRVGGSVEFAGAISGKLEHNLAKGFGGDGAEIDAAAADDGSSLDHSDSFVELRTLDRGALTGWPGTDHQEIVIE